MARERTYRFGCQAGGDAFKFVQETEGVGFSEAVELLAQRYGVQVEVEAEDPRDAERRMQRERLGIPVILLSGFGDFNTCVQAANKRASAFFPKPVELDRLFSTVRTLTPAEDEQTPAIRGGVRGARDRG